MRRLISFSASALTMRAAAPIAPSHCPRSVCCEPTWNETPYGSRPRSRALRNSTTAISGVQPNLRDKGQSAPAQETRMRQKTRAPGARVFCRILVSCAGADWPLSRKFGCTPEMAVVLLRKARDLGLDPYGVSFHVGSQQTDLGQWDGAIGAAARMFTALAETDINLRMVNIGGGFPAHYQGEVAGVARYAQAVTDALTGHFGNDLPEIIVEPGRSLVGDAGVIQSEGVLIADKGDGDRRWIYLDVGNQDNFAL